MLTTIPPTQAVGRRLDAGLCGQQECPQHISSWQGAGEDVAGEDYLSLQLLVSIVDSISACHAEDWGSNPRRGDLVLYCCPKTHTKVLLQPRVTEGVGHKKGGAGWRVGRESNPGQLLGRQLCSPLYHQRRRLDVGWMPACAVSKNARNTLAAGR
ncbi:unnamed protein product [Leuciscus chuanchicus]